MGKELKRVDFNSIKKIAIIGGSGSGKTTLANNLGKVLDLPVVHLDGLNYLPNWVERNKEERDKMIIAEADKEKWIIDGTYSSTLNYRLNKADLIIWLDFNTMIKAYSVLKRYANSDGKTAKEEIPGCVEKMDWEFFSWVLKWNHKKRKGIISAVHNYQDKTLIFKTRRGLLNWFKKQFDGVKIEY